MMVDGSETFKILLRLMRRSSRNFNIPLPPPPIPGNLQEFDYLLCPRSGEFDLCLHGWGKSRWGKLNRKYHFSNFFFRVPKGKEGGGGGGAIKF